MEFLTVREMNDRLTHNHVTESAEQHKYARLSMASYYYTNQTFVQEELFAYMPELQGYAIDTSLSTEEHSIFHNTSTGETVISFRGTSNLSDVKTDSHIALGREKHSERYKNSEKVYTDVSQKYRQDGITVVGHSLGGGIALHIGEKYDVASRTYNPAISPTQALSRDHYSNEATQTIYRTRLDPVSVGGEVIAGNRQPNRRVVVVGNHENHHAHSLENFFDNDAKRNGDGTFNVKQ